MARDGIDVRGVMDHDFMDRIASYQDHLKACLDIGACFGEFTSEALARGCEQVLAVEPDFRSFAMLCKVAEKDSRCLPLCAAVSDTSGSMVPLRAAGNIGQSSMLFDPSVVPNICSVAVTVHINQLLQAHPFTAMKMDVEGAEWNICRAIDPALLKTVTVIDMEIHSMEHPIYSQDQKANQYDMFELVRSWGYDVEGLNVSPGVLSGQLIARRRG